MNQRSNRVGPIEVTSLNDLNKQNGIDSTGNNRYENPQIVRPRSVHSVHSVEERYRKTQPLSLRRKLISGPTKRVSGCAACKLGIKRRWHKFKQAFDELSYKLSLFQGSFKSVEGYQGSGVLSYFVFMKWLLKLNFVIFLLMFLFTTLPQLIFPEQNYSSSVTGSSGLTTAVNLSLTCTASYTVTTSAYVVDNLQDFLQGTGWMEKTVMFFGSYSNKELLIGSTSDNTFNYNMPLAFLTVTAVCFLISLALMALDTGKVYKTSQTEERNFSVPNVLFSGWDYTIVDGTGAEYRHKSLYHELLADIDDARLAQERADQTNCDKCKLYTIRGLINFLIIGILGGVIYLIFRVSDVSTEYVKSDLYKSASGFVQLLWELLPSLTITALNSICPVVFGILIKFEKYSPRFQVQLMLVRIVFLKMVSLAVLVGQLYDEIDCTPVDSCGVGTGTCVNLKCWETYAGQQFYKLILTDFLVCFIMTFFVELPRRLIVTKCNCCLGRLIGLQEFDVPKNVLDLVYAQMLLWIGFFFAPIIPAMCVLKLFFTFYLKKFSALISCAPPSRPYKASKSNTFFMIILMFAYFLSTVPVIGSVVTLDPSKGCGPFRIYDHMFDIYTVMVSGWPSWLQAVINFLSSAVFVLPLLFILSLGIYYYYVVSRGNNDMVKMLKEQLVSEGRNKQYLMRQMSPGSKPSKGISRRPPPVTSPPVSTPPVSSPPSRPQPEVYNQPVAADDSWE